MDFVEVLELREGLIAYHRVYWGWYGVNILKKRCLSLMKYKLCLALLLISSSAFALSPSLGEKLYTNRCAMCRGNDARATGPLAQKSDPTTPDLTSCAYQKQLAQFPGRIVASIILMPGGSLIPDTLNANGIHLAKHVWTDAELRALNQYVLTLIERQPLCVNPKQFTWRESIPHEPLSNQLKSIKSIFRAHA